ncbi:MAG TPA: CheR family methyltransferase, partial [Labilithrix sp.]|nr:CheR family methyltransferase [Labilithrix sp.]
MSEYVAMLDRNPSELSALFDILLINVTSFFRDPPAWEALSAKLPSIVDLAGNAPIRLWSAGCSSGDEAYTLAIVMCEALGAEAFLRRVQIYATDVDEDALAHARKATYSADALANVPRSLVEKYFTSVGSRLTFREELRAGVVFGRHDLVYDAPIRKVDILVCRNALMYFDTGMQTRILRRFRFALNPKGVLLLGKAEMLVSHADLFEPLDLKLRLFARAVPAPPRRLVASAPPSGGDRADNDEQSRATLRRAAFDASPGARLVIDASGRVRLVNKGAAQLFGIAPSDVGRSFAELALSHGQVDFRACIESVRIEKRGFFFEEVECSLPNGDRLSSDVHIAPLFSEDGFWVGTQVAVTDATERHRLRTELWRVKA